MRELIAGVILGVIISMLPNFAQEHQLLGNSDVAFYGAIALLFVVLGFRYFLKLLMHISPTLFIKINRLTAPATMKDALRIEKKRKDKHNKNSDDK